MGEADFNTLAFEKKLLQLKDTQESIQGLSAWCLKQRPHHKKIVASWLNVLKRVKVEQRLSLFYLANDVIQYSKRKNFEFVDSWGLNLQKATPLVRDDKVRHKILRIFKIWEQRSVYDDEFLSDLTGLLSAGAVKKNADDDSIDFQPQQLVNKIRQCAVLEAETDLRLKYIHESHLNLSDSDALCASLKDRSNKDDVEKELNGGILCVEKYTQALQTEIVVREQLLELLTSASQYYSTQRGEVKVVAYAYKTFGARVKALKRKLDELVPQLPNAAPSPPQRDEDVPSPGPDEDLDLPPVGENSIDDVSYNIDKTFNTSLTADGSLYNLGLSSFLGTENPLSLFQDNNSQGSSDNAGKKIEVINNRPSEKQDFNINDFLKNLIPGNEANASDNISVGSGAASQKSQDALPGLDLLGSDGVLHPAPPTSFYGSIENSVQEEPDQYTESNNQWTNPSWSLPPSLVSPPLSAPVMVPPVVPLSAASILLDTPESPPPAAAPAAPPVPVVPATRMYAACDLPAADVDHRGLLLPPPPPPPPPLLTNITGLEDIDHRLLPSIAPPPAASTPVRNAISHNDVDHRNLISLTHQISSPRQLPRGIDQDYRVPPPVNPTDIVESVDMDLSEDDDQQQMAYPSQMIQNPQQHAFNPPQRQDEQRRPPFSNQNNKLFVSRNNGKNLGPNKSERHNLVRINSFPAEDSFEQTDKRTPEPLSAPPFTDLPQNFNELPPRNLPPPVQPFQPERAYPPNVNQMQNFAEDMDVGAKVPEDNNNSNDSAYEDDFRQRFAEQPPPREMVRNPSPPMEWASDNDWNSPNRFMINQMNPRFQRNWNPVMRTFRPNYPQFWPRNGPRPPNRPWLGPRHPRGNW